MSMPKIDAIKETAHMIKSKPEHVSNVTLASGYGFSIFLEHQYLVLMAVAYMFVTVMSVGHEVHELHDVKHPTRV